MSQLRLLQPQQRQAWIDALAQAGPHDFYHLPEYHALEAEREGAAAQLLVYSEGPYVIALPLLIRGVEQIAGLDKAGHGLRDATSVYGYAGPVAFSALSGQPAADAPTETALTAVRHGFGRALRSVLSDFRVVAVFSRLHPLLGQPALLEGLGECHATGQTISIDLTLPPEEQRARYRRTHRAEIRQLREAGATCAIGRDPSYLQDFVAIYHETMNRVNARESYFFDRRYFEALLAIPGERVHVCVARQQGQPISAALLTTWDGIIQHHLAGTRDTHVRASPMKLINDDCRIWANERRFRVYHLGGGLGAKEDRLFGFKAGFSERRHPFFTWRWRVVPELYERLCAARRAWLCREGLHHDASYFPEYRAPAVVPPQNSGKHGV